MCGRFTREYTWKDVHDFLDLRLPGQLEFSPSWNVAPTQTSPVCRIAAGSGEGGAGRELVSMRWGLVPFWAESVAIGSKLINARSEGIETAPAFRAAFRGRRCIVPVSGFYEWQKVGGGAKQVKQPYYIVPSEGRLLALAGLWERWGKGDATVESFTIITTAPNAMMAQLHDRMPAILDMRDFDAWLDPARGADDALRLLRPAAEGTLDCWPVSARVNSPRNDAPDLVARATDSLF
jgi:putative SOS response-associated peptidase YedK